MNRLWLLLLGLTATALVGVIVLEADDPDSASETAIVASRPAAASLTKPPDETGSRVPEWAATVLARPLFSRDRRPAAQSAIAVSSGGPLLLPRLTGVIVTRTTRNAIFAGPAGGHAVVIGEGGKLGRYTVQKIEAGRVVIASQDGRQTLTPHVDKASSSKSSPRQVGTAIQPDEATSPPGSPQGSSPGEDRYLGVPSMPEGGTPGRARR